jgi:arsenite transporter
LFGFQGRLNLCQPLVIALLAVPIVIQVNLDAVIAYAPKRVRRLPHAGRLPDGGGTPAVV